LKFYRVLNRLITLPSSSDDIADLPV